MKDIFTITVEYALNKEDSLRQRRPGAVVHEGKQIVDDIDRSPNPLSH